MTPLFADSSRWLTALPPIWMVGIAAAGTMTAAVAAYGLMKVIAPRLAAEARASLGDGFLGPATWLGLTYAAVAVACLAAAAVGAPGTAAGHTATAAIPLVTAPLTVEVDEPAGLVTVTTKPPAA